MDKKGRFVNACISGFNDALVLLVGGDLGGALLQVLAIWPHKNEVIIIMGITIGCQVLGSMTDILPGAILSSTAIVKLGLVCEDGAVLVAIACLGLGFVTCLNPRIVIALDNGVLGVKEVIIIAIQGTVNGEI